MDARIDERGRSRRQHGLTGSRASLLALGLIGVGACQTALPRQTQTMRSTPSIEMSTHELRTRVHNFHDYTVTEVERAAYRIAEAEHDHDRQLNALQWRNGTVSAVQEFAFHPDPYAGLAGMLVFIARMRDYLDGPAATTLFGPSDTIAIDAIAEVQARGRTLAKYVLRDEGEAARRLARVDSVAAADPLQDVDFLEGTTFVPPNMVLNAQGGGLAAVAGMEESLSELSDRVNIYYRYLPRQMRWEMEVLALKAYDEVGEDFFANAGEIATSLASLDARVEMLSDSALEAAHILADETVVRERTVVLSEVDRQRLATLQQLHEELALLLGDVERQRSETLATLDATVAATRASVMDDARAMVDEVVRRVVVLAVLLGGAFFLALGLLVVLYNRTRASVTPG